MKLLRAPWLSKCHKLVDLRLRRRRLDDVSGECVPWRAWDDVNAGLSFVVESRVTSSVVLSS